MELGGGVLPIYLQLKNYPKHLLLVGNKILLPRGNVNVGIDDTVGELTLEQPAFVRTSGVGNLKSSG